MKIEEINSFLAPIGLIIAGIIIRKSKNNSKYGFYCYIEFLNFFSLPRSAKSPEF